MRRNPWFSRPLGLAALAAFIGTSSVAFAEVGEDAGKPVGSSEPSQPVANDAKPPDASPTTPAAEATAPAIESPLAVVVQLEGYETDPVMVRLAVARELGVTVTSSAEQAKGEVRVIARKGAELSVVYRSASGAELMRSVAAPTRDDEVPEAAALLAGNLARDEASPLIASLTPKERPAEPEAKEETKPLDEKPKAPPERKYFPVNLSLFHPLTLIPNADEKRFTMELGLFYSRVGAVDALSVNPILLQVEGPAHGLQVAGLVSMNEAGGDGLRASGVFGYQEGKFHGLGVSGLGLVSTGDDRGMQAAGTFVYHRGNMLGGAFAGVASVNDGALQGAQVAGVASVAFGEVQGLQAANVSVAPSIEGAQLSVVNVARAVNGAQIAVVNVGGRVKGLQFGVVNVAEDVDGASIGVVTYSKSGRIQPFVWGSTTSPANVGVRFYTGPLFAMPMIGFEVAPDPARDGGDVATFSPGFSLGGRIPITRAFVDIEANYSNPAPEFRYDEHTIDLRYRLWAGFEVTSWFAPMVGGGVHHHFRTEGDRQESFDPELAIGLQFF